MILDKFQTHFDWRKCMKLKRNHKKQFLQYLSTRIFMENSIWTGRLCVVSCLADIPSEGLIWKQMLIDKRSIVFCYEC